MKKKLLVGADPFPPYQYYDEQGNLCGSDYETVRHLFAQAGFAVEVKLRAWDEIAAAMENDEFDAVFQVQKTQLREERYYFSDLLRNAVTEVITGNEELVSGTDVKDKINSFSELESKGLSLGVINNYAYGEEVDCLSDSLKVAYDSQEDLLRAIEDQEVDLGIFDRGVKAYLQEKAGINNIYVIESLGFVRPLYVMFNKEELRNAFCEAMKMQREKNGGS